MEPGNGSLSIKRYTIGQMGILKPYGVTVNVSEADITRLGYGVNLFYSGFRQDDADVRMD